MDQRPGDPLSAYVPLNVTSQVIVHGHVTVRGSVIDSPQVTVLGGSNLPPTSLPPIEGINVNVLRSFSPALVDQKLGQANHKLKYMREKLSHAVYANLPNESATTFYSKIQLFGNVLAKEVIMRGVDNSEVLINGIQFKQLEHELVSLRGSQTIVQPVQFRGRVVADMLEIHALINDKYRLKDAIDITSRSPQVIELGDTSQGLLEFHAISTPEVKMTNNSTLNGIHLGEFITRDNRTQLIYGRKVFKRLSMDRLDLASHGVPLNGFNLSEIAQNAIHLRDPRNVRKFFHQEASLFQAPVFANKLMINNVINQHINVSLLIQDSVKTVDSSIQQITGFKSFNSGMKINRLNTRGSINGIKMDKVFNLNNGAPFSANGPDDQLVSGSFVISNLNVIGNLSAAFVNGIDIAHRAVRRAPYGQMTRPMVVRGRKTFFRPLRIIDNVTLLDANQIGQLKRSNISATYPLINGIDLKRISSNLALQMQKPAMVYIDNLEIDGNIELPTGINQSLPSPRVTFGDGSFCPIDSIRSKLLTAGLEEQTISIPVRVDSLRARVVDLAPRALNGLDFPNDFVLRTSDRLQPVYGVKNIERLTVASSPVPFRNPQGSTSPLITLGGGANVNQINHAELRTFSRYEASQNSTGEQLFNTIIVHGNIKSSRINGHSWPEDILLKNLGTVSGPPEAPNVHNRIYSPLVFLNSSLLQIQGQLVLRGPIKLRGRLNGVNLTEFARHSVTYGDKDLLYSGRPLSNKIFLGGITVRGELRSQGLLDGVDIEEMKRRVVTVGPRNKRIYVTGPKIFMSDSLVNAPVSMLYLNDIPINNYLSRIRFETDGRTIRIFGKKIITGTLKVNRNLLVDGLINGIDFAELSSKAISLSHPPDQLIVNKTLNVEGDVYMDDLLVDQRNGTIDGIKLRDMMPKNPRLVLNQPQSMHGALLGGQPSTIYPNQMISKPYPVGHPLGHPISVQYERVEPEQLKGNRPIHRVTRSLPRADQLIQLRNRIVPISLVSFSPFSGIVIGFIDSQYQNLAGYQLPPSESLHYDHSIDDLRSFSILDQIDFSYNPITYHLSAVVSRGFNGPNITSVQASIGGRPHELMSTLPVEHPNTAMFINDAHNHALFLLISQDYTVDGNNGLLCPASGQIPTRPHQYSTEGDSWMNGNIHVYLFHVLQNSSSLRSAYFDLYQTVDLPEVDGFVKFYYRGSTYVCAVSRATSRIYLMILRGFSGFQLVSHIDVPLLDHVEIVTDGSDRPALVIHFTNGWHKVMESVII